MIPPRRAVKDGGVSDAGTSRSRESLISKIYNQNLKPIKGWHMSRSGPDDWTFVPPSLKHFNMNHLRKYGTAGVHYANGWGGLADMYESHGPDYAPTLTVVGNDGNSCFTTANQANANSRRVTISPTPQQENEEEDVDDEETVAFEPVTNDQHEGHESQIEIKVELDEQQNEVIVIQDDDEEEGTGTATVTGPHDSTDAIDKIIASIGKINEQIAWVNDNPGEQTNDQAKRMKQQLVRTKEKLLNQLSQYDSDDQVFL